MKAVIAFLGMALILMPSFASASDGSGKLDEKKMKLQRQLVWRLKAAHLVAYQPAVVGWARFAESQGIKDDKAAGKELKDFAAQVKEWPRLKLNGDQIVISEKGRPAITVQPGAERDQVLINNRIFRSPAGHPATYKDMNAFLSEKSVRSAPSLQWISEARADNSSSWNDWAAGVGIGTASYMLTTGTANAVLGWGAEAFMGGSLIGAGITTAAYGLTVGAVGCGMAAVWLRDLDIFTVMTFLSDGRTAQHLH